MFCAVVSIGSFSCKSGLGETRTQQQQLRPYEFGGGYASPRHAVPIMMSMPERPSRHIGDSAQAHVFMDVRLLETLFFHNENWHCKPVLKLTLLWKHNESDVCNPSPTFFRVSHLSPQPESWTPPKSTTSHAEAPAPPKKTHPICQRAARWRDHHSSKVHPSFWPCLDDAYPTNRLVKIRISI